MAEHDVPDGPAFGVGPVSLRQRLEEITRRDRPGERGWGAVHSDDARTVLALLAAIDSLLPEGQRRVWLGRLAGAPSDKLINADVACTVDELRKLDAAMASMEKQP